MTSKAKTHKKQFESGSLLIKLWIGIIVAGVVAGILSVTVIPSVMNGYKTAVDSKVQADIEMVAGEIEMLAFNESLAFNEKLAFSEYSNAPLLSFEVNTFDDSPIQQWPTIDLLDPDSGYLIDSATVRVNPSRTTITVEGTIWEYTITGRDPRGNVAADKGYVYNSRVGFVGN